MQQYIMFLEEFNQALKHLWRGKHLTDIPEVRPLGKTATIQNEANMSDEFLPQKQLAMLRFTFHINILPG